jgi:translation elongation factor EF-1alpha
MAVSGALVVEQVIDISDEGAVCIVRCLHGSVSTGDVVTMGETAEGQSLALSLKIKRIWRYEREVDFVDPPHVAKIELSGHESASIAHSLRLYADCAEESE